ncbi:MAG: GNAT family N-acetyltransferase [Micavibrio aeruginosavorus]|uniref:GNAT family N-acetyltransferase n=1 Tax=Micavibrio aeruginosavorus TaxID=349221 RepID=A0A7T5R105_9BACT|nr:MAG: GNAT family N-acetyltransferase [Micavibrio aeruginosavorus]
MKKFLAQSQTKKAPLYSGHLRTTNQQYEILQLDSSHLDQVIDLHKTVQDALSDDEKPFLLPKSPEYFARLFKKTSPHKVIGILQGRQLIAKAIATYPTRAKPESGMTDMADEPLPARSSVLQAVTVLPAYRGNRLMHEMVHAWINHSYMVRRKHVLSEVEVRNVASWSVFLDEGLEITSIGQDPDDGAWLYNMQSHIHQVMTKRLSQRFNHAAENSVLCPAADWQTQKELLAQGFAINGYKKDSREMILTPRI